MIQAYYFRNTYPHIIATAETEWTRVEAYGEKPGFLMSCMLWSLKDLSNTEASHIWRRSLNRSCK